MKRTLLTLIAVLLLGGAAIAQNHWDAPDSHAKSSNTPIVASVTVDDAAPAQGAELAAFVGNETTPRGLATAYDDGKFWVQVFYNSGTTETLTFKLWDPTDEGTELDTYTLTYDNLTELTTFEEGYGTPGAPVQIAFTATQTQSTQLASGWNWWSTPIEMNGVDGLTMLENSLGENGVYITTQGMNVENYYSAVGYNYWWGNLSEIQNESGYKLMVSSACNVAMTGRMAQPESHPITIQPNWTWIGYPCSNSQLISNATFEPSNNDIIQSQGGGSTYYEGYGWWPDFNMETGKGYLYYSNSSTTKTMTFSNARGVSHPVENNRYWSHNCHAYPDNIVIIADVFLDQEELRDDNIEVGAFVNGENRGSSKLMYFQPLDKYFALFTISGQSGDLVEFKLIDTHTEMERTDCDTHFTFEPYTRHGSLDEPIELHFGNYNRVITLFPNPVNCNSYFSLNVPDGEKITGYYIFDELGVLVRHEEGRINTTSIKGLPVAGCYTIKVICGSDQYYYSKLIVK